MSIIGSTKYVSKKAIIDRKGVLELGEDVAIDFCRIILHDHPFKKKENWIKKPKVWHKLKIEKNAFIGYGAIITFGCSFIAEGVVIGAGSVVTKDIDEPYSIWGGNPARKIGVRE